MKKIAWAAASVLLSLAAAAQTADTFSPAQACADEYATCDESCTMDYGTSVETRKKLGWCMLRCQEQRDKCPQRFIEAQRKRLEAASADAGSKLDAGTRPDSGSK